VTSSVASLPVLGSGLGYRRELHDEITAAAARIDFVEIIAEQYMNGDEHLAALEELCDIFPVIPHGVSLSVGSAAPVDDRHLRAIERLMKITGAPYFSEHLAVTSAPGLEIGHLSPLWFTEAALTKTAENVSRVQERLGRPLALENVSYLFDLPGAQMTQAEFFTRLVDQTSCGVLLDVTNVYINSINHEFDPIEFLQAMPLEAVVQIHLAGGYMSDGVMVDGHCEPVQDGSWALLGHLVELASVKGSIVEHDANFTPETANLLLDQVERARRILHHKTKTTEVTST
jgi:uncharacterized protein (UPF0276 family)